MKRLKTILFATGMAVLFSGCIKEKFNNLLQNPNAPTPEQADANLYFNQVQLSFSGFYNSMSEFGASLTRMETFFGPNYNVGYSPESFDGIWTTGYTGIIKNADALIALGTKNNLWYHVGAANVLKAYTLMTLTDNFGDIPFVEANQGAAGNLNPKYSSGSAVYAGAGVLLDSAILQLARVPGVVPTNFQPSNDLFYGSESSATNGAAKRNRWISLARTLKLRALINTRRVDAGVAAKINALIAIGDFIDTDGEEFTFKFSTILDNPNSRHPKYNGHYRVTGGAAGDYVGVNYLFTMSAKKILAANIADPRRRFYFYRQSRATPGTLDQHSCAYNATPTHYPVGMPYCFFSNTSGGGYWGRDHGDNSGIPPDNAVRTVFGVYPAGGEFDDNSSNGSVSVSTRFGARGAGIHPIVMSWHSDFMIAEALLTIPGIVAPNPSKTYMLNGVNKNINRVVNFGTSIGYTFTIPATIPAAITSYTTYVSNNYDLAIDDNQRLDILGEEYYCTLWGNGIEAYNLYRRTSRPRNMQLTINANSGTFIRSFFYPSVSRQLNINAPSQKANMGVKVFWDTNPDPLQ